MTEFDLGAFLVGAGLAGGLGLLALALVRWMQGGSRQPPSRASSAASAGAASLPDGLKLEVQSLLQRGRKIEAVKLVRERMDWGLKRAKEAVEALE